jgi:ABC-type lipoprotein export system ATPase subunit
MTFQLRDVTCRYPTAPRDALCGVSIDLPGGGVLAVLGLSGSGKTTLLNLLGLLGGSPLTRGDVAFRSASGTYLYRRLGAAAGTRVRRDHFGFVLQSSYLLPHFSCAQNVGVPLALRGASTRDRRRRVRELLERADPSKELLALADRSPREVSGGEKQRMAVLRAIVHDPDVVFADEPFSSLDPRNGAVILSLLRSWQKGALHGTARERTLILVSHHLESAYHFAESFLLLRQGEVVHGAVLTARDLPGGSRSILGLL